MGGSANHLLMRQIGVPLLLAILATALATPILLVRYRLRLSAWMARRADDALPAEPPLAHRPASLPSANALLGRSRSAVRARARAWFAGFAAQALVLTAIVATGFGSRLSGPALLVVLAVLLLPAALVLLTASAASGWTRLLGLIAGLLPVLVWPGTAGELLRSMAQLYVLVPLLPLLLFHLRFWRGAAPQVFLLSL